MSSRPNTQQIAEFFRVRKDRERYQRKEQRQLFNVYKPLFKEKDTINFLNNRLRF